MVLNTHLIDLRNVTNKRACSECKCSHFDGGKCPVDRAAYETNQTYFLRYTLKWQDFDPAVTKPLEVISLDATDNNTKWADWPFIPGGFHQSHAALHADPVSEAIVLDNRSGDYIGESACHIEFFVPPCKVGDACIYKLQNSWEVPFPVDIVFLRNHFHNGGINMTTSGPLYNCTGHGTYENGTLIDVSTCTTAGDGHSRYGKSRRVERGERFVVEAFYKQDQLPHYGVMAMSFVYAHIPPVQVGYV